MVGATCEVSTGLETTAGVSSGWSGDFLSNQQCCNGMEPCPIGPPLAYLLSAVVAIMPAS